MGGVDQSGRSRRLEPSGIFSGPSFIELYRYGHDVARVRRAVLLDGSRCWRGNLVHDGFVRVHAGGTRRLSLADELPLAPQS